MLYSLSILDREYCYVYVRVVGLQFILDSKKQQMLNVLVPQCGSTPKPCKKPVHLININCKKPEK